ncbi:MAG: bifunctional phosphoribosylaminoimidazolecarboxamide formyltransferase/IMP cyclohydrolase [Burkholderiaceae bacterium]
MIRRALLSVSDKTGVVAFARALADLKIELLSTGGTAKLLTDAGLGVVEVADYTGFPEMLDGRVKTLHPKIHGGLLARRDVAGHIAAIEKHGIGTIDLLVVDLYPFEATVARPDCSLDEAIENIDIGGPAMVRSAAKNWKHVAVVTEAAQYETVIAQLTSTGDVSETARFALAVAAFDRIARYDGAISDYLSSVTTMTSEDGKVVRAGYPAQSNPSFVKVQDLRYGENPHQTAALYRDPAPVPGTLVTARQLQGKALSYNNLADADAAWECVKSFAVDDGACACVIVKHANPCGVAIDTSPADAYAKAFATDPTSAFGGIIAFNRTVDATTVEAVAKQFVEVLVAPAYTSEALVLLAGKTNLRVLEVASYGASSDEAIRSGWAGLDIKRIGSGILVQSLDDHRLSRDAIRIVTKKQPTEGQIDDLLFAWRVAKFVKSNAIVFCAGGRTLGVGAGQMSRIDSARIASIKAEHAGLSLHGSAVASDAFFPFRDGLDVVAEAGASCVIQPGGSVRDAEVIAAADERGIAMVLTGVRHFRH